MNPQDMNAGKAARTSPQASEADVTGLLKSTRSTTQQPEATGSSQGQGPQSTDRWFDEQLNRLFNDVSSEPLPPELASLVGKLRAQGSKPDDK